jgi:hypothetical protein
MDTLEVPGLGITTFDAQFGWFRSAPLFVPALDQECEFILEGYAEDEAKAEFHEAIANVLSLTPFVLQLASPEIFRYYKDCKASWASREQGCPTIATAIAVWTNIEVGREVMVTRRSYGEKGVYISIECECAWEPEHGLQLVLKGGRRVTKVGPYDGHLTNSDAFARPDLESVIYAGA